MNIDFKKLSLMALIMIPLIGLAQTQTQDSLQNDTPVFIYVKEGAKLKSQPVVGSPVLAKLRN